MKIPKWVVDREVKRLLLVNWPDMPKTRQYAIHKITRVALDFKCYGGKVTWKCPRRVGKIKGGR